MYNQKPYKVDDKQGGKRIVQENRKQDSSKFIVRWGVSASLIAPIVFCMKTTMYKALRVRITPQDSPVTGSHEAKNPSSWLYTF